MAATDQTGTYQTDGSIGTKGQAGAAPSPVSQPETNGAGAVDARGWAPTPTGITGTKETTVSTVIDKQQPYKAPSAPPAAANADTTKTDSPVGNGLTVPLNPLFWMSGTKETASFGAVAAGTTTVPAAPNAPTAVAGDRYIQVSWTPVADPGADAKVTQYVVESDTGGHFYAGANATTLRFENVTGGQGYKFRVRAGNKNGDGPFSPFSASAVVASNEDEIRPTSLAADNAANPIYNQDGSIKPGSYGAPTAPGKPTVAAGATTTANVTWTAPSTGQPSGGYDVVASTGQKVHVAGNVLTVNVPGLTLTNVITFTVTAIGQLQNSTSPASNAYTVV
ncbi:fibronectin type III domain-containing protein [Streptomyces sp. NPDC048281]|uniref:fibronectin type III domain-containing protein n=1 Tax=Streptomyces sp. NPDC048281 TaxID=3154715 RepID=UPI003433668E